MTESSPHNQPTLLLVDDEPAILRSLVRVFREAPFPVITAVNGLDGLAAASRADIGVVVSDQRMPLMDGVSFLSALREQSPDTVSIMLTGYADHNDIVKAINQSRIFGYLQKPWRTGELRSMVSNAFRQYELVSENRRLVTLLEERNLELAQFNIRLEVLVQKRTRYLNAAIRGGVEMLAMAAEAKDDDTGEHVRRIQVLTSAMARAMGMAPEDADRIGFFSMMHDVGKIHIPDAILHKPGKLTAAEWAVMKTHTTAGEQILSDAPYYSLARQIARCHHERWDGSGYPDGLTGEAIPLAARIVSVADVYDALTHQRPYKPAWPHAEAMAEINAQSGRAFDPAVVTAFVEVVADNSSLAGIPAVSEAIVFNA